MNSVDYDSIEPLVENVNHNRSSMRVTFTCPRTGQSVCASAQVDDVSGKGSMVRSGIISVIFIVIRGWLFRRLGLRGFASRRAARRLTNKATRNARNNLRISDSQRKKAVVSAFRQVQEQFVWEESAGRWIHRNSHQ